MASLTCLITGYTSIVGFPHSVVLDAEGSTASVKLAIHTVDVSHTGILLGTARHMNYILVDKGKRKKNTI